MAIAPPASVSPLVRALAENIRALIASRAIEIGERLSERALAERFRVSRSPVRGALRLLMDEGVIGGAMGAGSVVLRSPAGDLPPVAASVEEDGYFQLAADRLDGRLPDRVTEALLARRYGFTRTQLVSVLGRIHAEGWIERLPGNGWAFRPMLTSLKSYADSYRFRITIEPAAILEPGYTIDRKALSARRAEQQRLIDGAIDHVSSRELFEINSRLHETIAEGSGNEFFVEGLKRIDRLRRLIEYRRTLDPRAAVGRCEEHVAIVDRLLDDDRAGASKLMRHHLTSVSAQKTGESHG
jgi:DNA-binding GntR family transcriptional regulator